MKQIWIHPSIDTLFFVGLLLEALWTHPWRTCHSFETGIADLLKNAAGLSLTTSKSTGTVGTAGWEQCEQLGFGVPCKRKGGNYSQVVKNQQIHRENDTKQHVDTISWANFDFPLENGWTCTPKLEMKTSLQISIAQHYDLQDQSHQPSTELWNISFITCIILYKHPVDHGSFYYNCCVGWEFLKIAL